MAEIDWSRGDLLHGLRVMQVDPNDLKTIRGELTGVQGGRLDLQYYGDTRCSATIETVGDTGWDGSAALRIVHTVGDYTGVMLVETLFTGFVQRVPWDGQTDGIHRTYEVAGTLFGVESDILTGVSVARGTSALDVVRQMCKAANRPYRIGPNATDYIFGSSHVYDAGASRLEILFDACERSGNRLSVDADGVYTFDRYVPPSQLGPTYSCAAGMQRGMVIGPIEGEEAWMSAPSTVIVSAESDNRSITARAKIAAGMPQAHAVRGYDVADYRPVTDLSPFDQSTARALAERYLREDYDEVETIRHSLMYRPLREGDIELLVEANGTRRRWLVSGASIDLSRWVWELELKGGWAA